MSILFDALRRARGEHSKWARTLGAAAPAAPRDRHGSWLPWLLCALLAALVAALGVYILLAHERGERRSAAPAQATLDRELRDPGARLRGPYFAATPGAAGRGVESAPVSRPADARESPAEPAGAAAQAGLEAADPDVRKPPAGAEDVAGHRERARSAAPVLPSMLPADVRRDFPRVRVVAHVWNGDPSRRFIIVDGRQLRVGERVADGVRLVEITRRGEIVAFRGYRIVLR